jgi:hypothetical protein
LFLPSVKREQIWTSKVILALTVAIRAKREEFLILPSSAFLADFDQGFRRGVVPYALSSRSHAFAPPSGANSSSHPGNRSIIVYFGLSQLVHVLTEKSRWV